TARGRRGAQRGRAIAGVGVDLRGRDDDRPVGFLGAVVGCHHALGGAAVVALVAAVHAHAAAVVAVARLGLPLLIGRAAPSARATGAAGATGAGRQAGLGGAGRAEQLAGIAVGAVGVGGARLEAERAGRVTGRRGVAAVARLRAGVVG